jgi:transposase-like protein
MIGAPPMSKDNVIAFNNPGTVKEYVTDTLTDLARQGATQMLAKALELEVQAFIAQNQTTMPHSDENRLIRNGYLPERTVQTGIGDIPIKSPRVRDKEGELKFISSIIPPYLKRSASIEQLLPLLYLKGISTGDFQQVLAPIFGEQAKNLSPGVISRLKADWENEYQAWSRSDLSRKHYIYWWADGIYLNARMEDASSCVLVIIGVTDKGVKELIAIEDGLRESKESWRNLLLSIKSRGLKVSPKLATGDGGMGFWAALSEIYPKTKHQRCWCHKVCNVLDKLPKGSRAQAKSKLQDIWMAESKDKAIDAINLFASMYKDKYPKAVECLLKDQDEMLEFYNFPAIHWLHIRTTNPIESTFSTVRHRTKKCKGAFSRITILTMVFKLCQNAQSSWKRIRGFERLAEVIDGVKFTNGLTESEIKKLEVDRNAA